MPKDTVDPPPHRLVAVGIWLALACVPLAWRQDVVAEYALPKLVALSAGVALAAAGLVASLWRGSRLGPTPLDLPLAAGAAALLLSLRGSIEPRLSLVGAYNLYTYGVWSMCLYAALAWLAAWGLSPEDRRRACRLSVATGAIVGAYALLQGMGREPFHLPSELPGGRAVSTLGSPVHLGSYLAMLLPLALHWIRAEPERRAVSIPCALAISGGLAATLTRGAWLVAAGGCALWLPLSGAWRPGRRAWLAAAAAALGLGLILGPRLARRPTRQSDVGRVEGWRVAWAAFRERPWLGHGPDSFGPVFRRRKTEVFLRTHGVTPYHADAHNDLLQALATTGLAGAAAYLWLLGALLLAAAAALRDPERRGEAAALAVGLAGLFVGMKLNPASLEVLTQAAVLAGLLCGRAAAAGKGGEGRSPAPAWVWACLLVEAAAISTGAALRLYGADRHAHQARRKLLAGTYVPAVAGLRRAAALYPCEQTHRSQEINALMDLVRADLRGPRSAEWLAQGEKAAAEAVRCHAGDFNSHYMLGYVSLIAAQLGDASKLPVCEAALDEALRLDPTYLPALHLREDAARLRKDAALLARLRAEIARLRAIVPKGTPD